MAEVKVGSDAAFGRFLKGPPALSMAAQRLRGLPRANILLSLALLLVVGYLVLVPLGTVLISSFKPLGMPDTPGWTFRHIQRLFTSPETLILMRDTMVFAAGSVVVALILGFTAGWLLERTDLPFRKSFRVLTLVPIVIPKLLFAMGWILLLAPRVGLLNGPFADTENPGPFNIYTMSGMIFVQGLSLSPMAFLLSAPVIARLNVELEEAAAIAGANQFTTLRRIILPLLWPTILGAASYLFVMSIVLFDIPALIGMPGRVFVLSTAIYDEAIPSYGLPNYGVVSALSLITLVMTAILLLFYLRMLRRPNRFVTVTGRGFKATTLSLGRWRWPVFAGFCVYCFLVLVLPLAAVVFGSVQPYWSDISLESFKNVTLDNYLVLGEMPGLRTALMNSLIVGVCSATLVSVLAVAVSWTVVRSKAPLRWLLDGLSVMPTGMPGVIVGVSLMLFYLSWGRFLPVYGSLGILIIAYVTEFLAYSTRSINAALLQLHPDLEEAAHVSGATKQMAIWRVVVPLIAPAIIGVWLWALSISLRSVSTALLLTGRDNRLYGVEVWSYWIKGSYNVAAAMGVVLMVLVVLIQIATLLVTRNKRA